MRETAQRTVFLTSRLCIVLAALGFGCAVFLQQSKGIGWGSSPRLAWPAAVTSGGMMLLAGMLLGNILKPIRALTFGIMLAGCAAACVMFMANR